jgi:hypothetical protein
MSISADFFPSHHAADPPLFSEEEPLFRDPEFKAYYEKNLPPAGVEFMKVRGRALNDASCVFVDEGGRPEALGIKCALYGYFYHQRDQLISFIYDRYHVKGSFDKEEIAHINKKTLYLAGILQWLSELCHIQAKDACVDLAKTITFISLISSNKLVDKVCSYFSQTDKDLYTTFTVHMHLLFLTMLSEQRQIGDFSIYFEIEGEQVKIPYPEDLEAKVLKTLCWFVPLQECSENEVNVYHQYRELFAEDQVGTALANLLAVKENFFTLCLRGLCPMKA